MNITKLIIKGLLSVLGISYRGIVLIPAVVLKNEPAGPEKIEKAEKITNVVFGVSIITTFIGMVTSSLKLIWAPVLFIFGTGYISGLLGYNVDNETLEITNDKKDKHEEDAFVNWAMALQEEDPVRFKELLKANTLPETFEALNK